MSNKIFYIFLYLYIILLRANINYISMYLVFLKIQKNRFTKTITFCFDKLFLKDSRILQILLKQ